MSRLVVIIHNKLEYKYVYGVRFNGVLFYFTQFKDWQKQKKMMQSAKRIINNKKLRKL
ncbi:hypothetical protein HO639_05645 [Streptococcus suis]|uniref:Uncharacterized protein n=1 Tax=Streptococcus suis TaxID=1307 RepID=A0A0Z8BD25_STRSU|nr:hypothetical protein [Streptococcus suis]NQH68371.1 hypothetical protein [Streptococcus suis]NQI05559.1 hypothetical protein [Streptococcus suis]NQQ99553.1 hypothetical protein [Streptococcus suis]CYU04792.1 Uncharacterised protein [Streptococcus suis]CYU41452.1 Uncharacterised protein [Streptococcus suis]